MRVQGCGNDVLASLSKVEAGAGLVITQNPLPPTPPKRATSLDFHGEECAILAYKSNAGEATTSERRRHGYSPGSSAGQNKIWKG